MNLEWEGIDTPGRAGLCKRERAQKKRRGPWHMNSALVEYDSLKTSFVPVFPLLCGEQLWDRESRISSLTCS